MAHTSLTTEAQGGYTLVEMIIVLAIVITGSAVAIPVTMRMVRTPRATAQS